MSTIASVQNESANASSERRIAEARTREPRGSNSFVPLLIVTIGFLAWTIFQTVMLARESAALQSGRENQQAQVDAAQKLRDALDGVARDTAKLADKGNPNARLIVEELRKRGVTINPNAPPAEKK